MVTLVLIVGMIVLSAIGVNIAPLLAGAGVLGIAIGFGSQKLVQDLITITHGFSSRLYGLRNYRKALEKALRDENRAQDPHEPDS